MGDKNNMSNMRLYELNYLVSLRESDKITEIAKKINDFITKQKGELIDVFKKDNDEKTGGESNVWVEKKRLAYPIKNAKGGYYLNSWFKLEPTNLTDLRQFLKLENEIMRFEILAEINVAFTEPTKDSVSLAEIDKLTIEKTEKVFEAKPNYERKPEIVIPKIEVSDKKEEKEEKLPQKPKQKMSKKVKEKEIAVIEEIKVPIVEKIPEKEEAKPDKEEQKTEPVQEDGKKEKLKKPKKISLEDLDKRLDDILNEEIL